ncbi:MAG: hypothetical protein LBR32_10535, partial [Propionibacteriaceae bacterium]|jgi:hypothetical protein|nr:hypothetical protein [Propionibacteriaceae bacterium]
MSQPRRALESVYFVSDVPARRAQRTAGSFVFGAVDSLKDVFSRESGSRYAKRRWHQGLAGRLALVGGACAVAVAAVAVAIPVTASTVNANALAATAAAEAAKPHLVLAGTLSEPGGVEDELTAQTWLYATGETAVHAKADADSKTVATLTYGTKVLATADVDGEWRHIVYDDDDAWVLDSELTKETPELAAGITMAPCPRGSAVENKLRADTIKIYRTICPMFPEVNSYGGWRAGGRSFHKNGRALDIMITYKVESALGWRIANYLTAHAKEFNIDHVIFEQKIWTPSTPRWRKMADRGSITENHYNHVHVAVRA